MTFFLDSMQRFFVLIFPMCDKARVLRRPGRVGSPDVIKDLEAHSITAFTGLDLIASWKMSITGPKSSAVGKINSTRVRPCTSLNHSILFFDVEKTPEEGHEILIASDKGHHSIRQGVLINQVLRIEVAKFEEFCVARAIIDVFLCSVEEPKLLLSGRHAGERRERFRGLWDKGWRRDNDISLRLTLIGKFRTLYTVLARERCGGGERRLL